MREEHDNDQQNLQVAGGLSGSEQYISRAIYSVYIYMYIIVEAVAAAIAGAVAVAVAAAAAV